MKHTDIDSVCELVATTTVSDCTTVATSICNSTDTVSASCAKSNYGAKANTGTSPNTDSAMSASNGPPPDKKPSYSQLAGMGSLQQTPKSTKIPISSQVQPEQSSLPSPPLAPPSQSSTRQSYKELCVFAVTGKCRFGNVCRNVHGLQCPRCLLNCLHPTDLEQNEEHIQECLEKPVKASNTADEEIECGICLDKVLSKPDPRFGLLNCEHPFCLACIRQWRASSTNNGNVDPSTVRSCPLCRVVTYFIVPSSQFIRDGEEKARQIDAYKRKVQTIPCRHWDFGRGRCPFGNSCFYNHALPDGSTALPDLPRSYVDANDQIKVIREFRLSDFLPETPGGKRS
jgi:hypothetical protein